MIEYPTYELNRERIVRVRCTGKVYSFGFGHIKAAPISSYTGVGDTLREAAEELINRKNPRGGFLCSEVQKEMLNEYINNFECDPENPEIEGKPEEGA